ncbi:Hypothetical Protein XCAW_02216 [Xanthomonas citri subsp. citri Aw12879]|nr:Hypothetical Protein XCAW_02216 [Xanthomonas citri subsp. citri Aw12879]
MWSALLLLTPCIAQAQVDLSRLDAEMAAPRTQVLVLGSVHLSQLPKGSDIGAARLQPLMDRLAAYKPTIICAWYRTCVPALPSSPVHGC